MSMPELPLEGPLVFYDVSAPAFAGLSRALPAEVLHYLSREGTLEFTRNVIENVSWED